MNTENRLEKLSLIIQFPSSMCLDNSQETNEEKIAFCDRQIKTISKIEQSKAFNPFVIEGLRATRDWWFNERIRIEKGASFKSYFFDCLKGDQPPLIKRYIQLCPDITGNSRLRICQEKWCLIDSCNGYGMARKFWSAEIGALQYHNAVEDSLKNHTETPEEPVAVSSDLTVKKGEGTVKLSSSIQYPSSMYFINSQVTKDQKIAFCNKQVENIDNVISQSKTLDSHVKEGLRTARDWWLNEKSCMEKDLSFFDFLAKDQPFYIKEYMNFCSISSDDGERLGMCQEMWSFSDGAASNFFSAEIAILQYYIAISEAPVAQPSSSVIMKEIEAINDWDSFKKLLRSNPLIALLALAITCQILAEIDEKSLINIFCCVALLLVSYIVKVGSAFNPRQDIQAVMKFIYQGGH